MHLLNYYLFELVEHVNRLSHKNAFKKYESLKLRDCQCNFLSFQRSGRKYSNYLFIMTLPIFLFFATFQFYYWFNFFWFIK